ncbi:hypothetical protein QBC33DRAFT_605009 [Phialemonium atrogriseum]|uniref:Kinetochore protein Sos7 coiled-coil domain-containing protein n=1 Tax=Phialemonium atrogriseum TaxID=1093897 RepID=A0AAJ0BNR4_9PEZI|nr:uncharacterized protein QBC33DRAFT_605009 [Phialemonium atrogriseum]KAK1761679.1 hypothetical protein QBC33DRAFT_605009 [Phialemonium atrogriseum]
MQSKNDLTASWISWRIGGNGSTGGGAPTPVSLEADLAHYRELFAKLRFSYVEQMTKEKFIRAVVGDPPMIVAPHENAALEASDAVLELQREGQDDDLISRAALFYPINTEVKRVIAGRLIDLTPICQACFHGPERASSRPDSIVAKLVKFRPWLIIESLRLRAEPLAVCLSLWRLHRSSQTKV